MQNELEFQKNLNISFNQNTVDSINTVLAHDTVKYFFETFLIYIQNRNIVNFYSKLMRVRYSALKIEEYQSMHLRCNLIINTS